MTDYVIDMYGVLRRQAQAEQLTVSLDDTDRLTVADLMTALANNHPAITETLKSTACAIDDELVSRDTLILPGQSLALIPPVSGGQ